MTKMVETQFFYRVDTLQVDAVYLDSKTNSRVFKDSKVYVEVNVVDPPYAVSRNHKVVLDEEGNVAGTEQSLNPVQPAPPPNPFQDLIDQLEGPDWTTGTPEKLGLLKKALLRLLGA